MATMVRRAKAITVELPDQPGELSKLMGALREAKVDLVGCWAYALPNKTGKAILIGKNQKLLEETLKKTGRKYATGDACFAEGEDRMGVFSDLLQKVSQGGVNIHAVDAVAVGGKFCSILWTDDGQFEKLCKTLGC